jgi:putative acetyltransferase
LVSLTAKGKKQLGLIHGPSNARVNAALSILSKEQRGLVVRGMNLYAESLRKTRMQAEVEIRPIRRQDNPALANVVRQCLAEFDGGGPGYATADPEFERLYETYSLPRSAYFVVIREGKVVGGAGVAPLKGAEDSICEFQKMYLLPELRGFGLGKHLLDMSVSTARELKYKKVYLETLSAMRTARHMYQNSGFKPIGAPLGKTGHYACDAWYVRDL